MQFNKKRAKNYNAQMSRVSNESRPEFQCYQFIHLLHNHYRYLKIVFHIAQFSNKYGKLNTLNIKYLSTLDMVCTSP